MSCDHPYVVVSSGCRLVPRGLTLVSGCDDLIAFIRDDPLDEREPRLVNRNQGGLRRGNLGAVLRG